MNALQVAEIRNGLFHFGRKLAQGRPVTLGYLGGSITESRPDGYAFQTTALLRNRYPDTAFSEVNAGIGGTASDFGAYRLRQDVLKHRPDLLLVEFAVNDSGAAHDVRAAMEGIVRQTRRTLGAECDIAFVYTLAQDMVETLQAGLLPPAAQFHEPVAEHYGLTSVNLALEVARRLRSGELTWPEFATDSCHPSARGHRIYCEILADALVKAVAVPESPMSMPPSLTPDPWDDTDLIAVPLDAAFRDWNYRPLVNRGGWDCFDGLLESNTIGSEILLEFTGSVAGLLYQVGPESGDFLWAVDNAEMVSARVFDDYSDKFWRPAYRLLAEGLQRGSHRLRIRVGSERDPRSLGHWVRLASLMVRQPCQ